MDNSCMILISCCDMIAANTSVGSQEDFRLHLSSLQTELKRETNKKVN